MKMNFSYIHQHTKISIEQKMENRCRLQSSTRTKCKNSMLFRAAYIGGKNLKVEQGSDYHEGQDCGYFVGK